MVTDMTDNRRELLLWLDSLGKDADRLYRRFKLWAFTTQFRLLIRREVDVYTAFGTAIAATADSGTSLQTLETWELEGFYRWFRESERGQRNGRDRTHAA